jgi:cytoskeletal protein RodZ
MKSAEKGFGLLGILAVVVVVGLVATVGWLAYERQEKNASSEETTTTNNESTETVETEKELSYKTLNGIRYTTPENWKNVDQPFEPYTEGSGQYLISPDYEEAGLGQLSIESGAYITFSESILESLNSSTTTDQAVALLKNNEDGYYDPASVKTTTIADVQIITYNSGHTTDGETVLYKTSSNTWLEATFSTITGGDGQYTAQASPLYPTFQSWLEEFVSLNK